MKISHNTLMILLVVAIVVTVVSTVINLRWFETVPGSLITGQAVNTTTGTSTLTIQSQTSIMNRVSAVAFGSGYINSTNACSAGCTIDTITGIYSGNETCCALFNNVTAGFLLENIGNENVTLNMTCSGSCTAATFIGSGTNPVFQFKTDNLSDSTNKTGDSVTDTSGSCNSGGGYNYSDWTTMAASTFDLCATSGSTDYWMNYVDLSDALRVNLKVTIPSDVDSSSQQTATFTFGARSAG